MYLQELLKHKDALHAQIVKQIETDSDSLKTLADNMAECASNMNGQGYNSFIASRESFLSDLNRVKSNYLNFVNPSFLYTSTRQ